MTETRASVWDEKVVALTEDERRDQWGDVSMVLSYTFTRRRDGTGGVTVSEQWDGMDELWGSGVSITLPPRALKEFLDWVSTSPPHPTETEGRI